MFEASEHSYTAWLLTKVARNDLGVWHRQNHTTLHKTRNEWHVGLPHFDKNQSEIRILFGSPQQLVENPLQTRKHARGAVSPAVGEQCSKIEEHNV